MVKNDLTKRMKNYYENRSKTYLMRRTPVIVRVDGKAFHTFTKGMVKPFDDIITRSMQDTMLYLCEHMQGAVFGYTQSDEITIVLVDYKNLDSQALYDYSVQKICSITASMATFAFNMSFAKRVASLREEYELKSFYKEKVEKGALFDARCFNIPKEEVVNCIIWRQLDGMRNAVSGVGQAHFSQKELNKKTKEAIKQMLLEKDVDFEQFPKENKIGSACFRENGKFFVDTDMPFIVSDKYYVEKWVQV